MHYETRFLHRIQKDFLIVGLHDYEELSQAGTLNNRYVELSMEALCCLCYFPNVEHLILTPGEVTPEGLWALRGLNIKSLKLDYYTYEIDSYTIDLACFPQLELVFARTQCCYTNIVNCSTLQTLIVQEWLTDNLNSLSNSSIKALKIFSGRLRSLNGVERLPNLVSLSIANQRQLVDCEGLRMTNLESIEIISCNKVETTLFPVLSDLRFLHLSGKKAIPNVATILCLAPRLEWLLLDHAVEDGNLSPLTNLSHAVIFTDHRHYSHKNVNLPKAAYRFHSDYLSENLAVLPEAY